MQYKISALILSLVLSSCSSIKTLRDEKDPNTTSQKLVEIQQEVSLTNDRSELEKLREDTPEAVKTDNDELAFILDFFKDIRRDESSIRSRFNNIVRRKQERYRKRIRKLRKDFTKEEKKNREAFLKNQKEERKSFLKRDKVTKDERKDFFDKQDEQRKDYFAGARDKRKDFESQLRASQKDQDAYFREKRKIFNEEMRLFRNRKRDWKKEQKEKAKARANAARNSGGSLYPAKKLERKRSPLEVEFDALNQIPAQPLEAE